MKSNILNNNKISALVLTSILSFHNLANAANSCDADFDKNGIVNSDDVTLFRAAIGTSNMNYDLNKNGYVNAQDLIELRKLLGQTCVVAPPPVPTASFSASASAVNENGLSVSLQIKLSSPASSPVVITINSIGNATRNSDYSRPDTITIPAGQLNANLVIKMIDDNNYEGNETAVLSIAAVTSGNATIGSPAMNTLSIVDNESAPVVLGQATITFDEPITAEAYLIGGYRIMYGTSSNNLNTAAPDLPATSFSKTISGLTKGATYYFAVKALAKDVSGIDSELSAPVMFKIP
jgi:hypothetical protein